MANGDKLYAKQRLEAEAREYEERQRATPPLVHGTLDISPQPASWTFASNSKEIVRIYPDGRVVKNPELSWDEAALAFWEAVERTRAPQPSVPSGEAVAWGLADANGYLRGAKLYRGNLPEAKRDLESALNIELHEVPLYAAPPQDRVSEAMVETLAKRLAAEAYVDTRHRDLLPVEPFSWDVMLTDFQREQWSGRARLHLDAALSAGRGE